MDGFKFDGFLAYLQKTFYGFDGIEGNYPRNLAENIVRWLFDHKGHTRDEVAYAISDIFPGISFEEACAFMSDEQLTPSGLKAKEEGQHFVREQEIFEVVSSEGFLKEFGRIYTELYRREEPMGKYQEEMDKTSRFIQIYPEAYQGFVQKRGDVIMSDREYVSFALALNREGIEV